MYNEIIKDLAPTTEQFFTNAILIRANICKAAISSVLEYRLFHAKEKMIVKGLPYNGDRFPVGGAVFEYARAVKEILFQMAKVKYVSFDQLVENSKAEAEKFFAKCKNDFDVAELCNVFLTRISWGNYFVNNKKLDLEPLAAVVNLIQMQSKKMGDPFLSVLNYVLLQDE